MSITWLEYARLVRPDIIDKGIYEPCTGCSGDLDEIGVHWVTKTCPYDFASNKSCTKCWNEVIPYPVIAEAIKDGYYGFKYKVGDKFTIRNVTVKCNELSIESDSYYIPNDKTFKFYIDKDYGKGEKEMQKEFTRDDLKDGMMCEMRNGRRMLWMAGAMRDCNTWHSRTQHDLTGEASRDHDIVKVGYPDFDNNKTIKCALNSDFKEVIWERKEEKEISSDEAFRVLKEHYGCDVKIKER